MGAIVLFDISAIEAWDLGRCKDAEPIADMRWDDVVQNSGELAGHSGLYPWLSRPVHILVNEAKDRRNSARWKCHVRRERYPLNSFFLLEEGVYIAAPYLCFATMARRLSWQRSALLGMELCGRYSTLPLHKHAGRTEWGKGYLERPALASRVLLSRYAEAFGCGKRSSARRACRVIAGGARSPMESILYLLFTLKRSCGGYAQSGFEINARLQLPPFLAAVAGVPEYEVDLYRDKGRLALEYDGRDYHADDSRRAYDNVRRSVLGQLGIRHIGIDKHQLHDMRALDGVAALVAAHIGEPPVANDPRSLGARMALRAELLMRNDNLYGCD